LAKFTYSWWQDIFENEGHWGYAAKKHFLPAVG
jgi:hypothetical protein